MFKMNQLVVGLFLFLSSLFSCQQKGDFKTVNVEDFDSIIQDEEVQRLDVRTLAEYSEGHIAKTININVMDDSFASMADSLLQKNKPVALYCRSGKRSKKAKVVAVRLFSIYSRINGCALHKILKGCNRYRASIQLNRCCYILNVFSCL